MFEDIRRASLPESMPRLGDGGEGIVYALDAAHRYEGRPCAYKEYKPHATIHEADLRAMVAFLGKLNEDQRDWLLRRAAWPTRIVVDDAGAVTGFIMPLIPEAFFGDFSVGQNVRRSQKEVQLLLNDPAFIAKRGIALDEGAKYAFLADVADMLRVLHGAGIVIGDLSARNILFNIGGTPASFLIDCDSMRMPEGDNPALVQTPGWEAPQAETEATIATDLYKLGLLVLRLLTGQQMTRDTALPAPGVPMGLHLLLTRAIDGSPGDRPGAGEWCHELRAVLRESRTTVRDAGPGRGTADPSAIPTAEHDALSGMRVHRRIAAPGRTAPAPRARGPETPAPAQWAAPATGHRPPAIDLRGRWDEWLILPGAVVAYTVLLLIYNEYLAYHFGYNALLAFHLVIIPAIAYAAAKALLEHRIRGKTNTPPDTIRDALFAPGSRAEWIPLAAYIALLFIVSLEGFGGLAMLLVFFLTLLALYLLMDRRLRPKRREPVDAGM
ncbi:hypothetical protein CSPHI_02025 [Corynebacterium sphenisci DSM 44792]|uniref:Protein kinase domain-containing protein n=1 Tax=Corynebacterium sphenisci DSM 44792 TaxID=1437874 RepID=A0A1L7CVZ8_9CORY|nr:hypothetical protein [Corynebacterium sphenisci]APT90056.1 hypothetical protein CSPHI_02025 [Corynebacterium sphenisci DSM 44792]